MNRLIMLFLLFPIGLLNAEDYRTSQNRTLLSDTDTLPKQTSSLSLYIYDNKGRELGKIIDGIVDSKSVAPYVVDEVHRRVLENFDIGTYRVYTTVDMEQQKLAKKSLLLAYNNELKNQNEKHYSSTINGGILVLESKTGNILALVGGVDYKKSSINHITMERKKLGTVFYPFIYQIALNIGYDATTQLADVARILTYHKNGKIIKWKPNNFQNNFSGSVSLRKAMVESRNLATINLSTEISIQSIFKKLKLFNINQFPNNISIALGNIKLSPLKVSELYLEFSNSGDMVKPVLISKIIHENNMVVYENIMKRSIDTIKPEETSIMTNILQDVLKKGLEKNVNIKEIDLAGQVGRVDNKSEWFCGYSPSTEVIVWFGRENNMPIRKGGTNGEMSVLVASDFFKKLYKLYPDLVRKFNIPKYSKSK